MCSRYDLSKSSVTILLPAYRKNRLNINLNRSILSTGGVPILHVFQLDLAHLSVVSVGILQAMACISFNQTP